MKVLAIRGRNIASLAGEFEIDFRLEPLASAGLFAICGPTGSGKSTLLDAMCLALYDKTPRLQKASRQGVNLPDVGEDTITPQDARNLLRRGTGEGCVEVEFLGGDGEAYRARWAVRRARGRVDGRLQAAEMSLVRLSDGQAIGDLKTEVLAAIEQRLGLTFDQFTRAVLLAQNEFTAFLQADDNARASLLEQLTGTDIYTSLSMQAFERARTEQQVLETLLARIGDFRPLETDARTGLERRASEARIAAEKLETDAKRLDEQLRWHDELHAARGLEDQARKNQAETARQREEASERRAHLARVESVQPAAARVDDCDRTVAEARASREEEVPRVEREESTAAEEVGKAEVALNSATQGLAQADRNLRAAVPHIEQARQLDGQLSELKERRVASDSERERFATVDAAAHGDLSDVGAERESYVTQKQAADDWLERHGSWRNLGEDWLRWDTLYRQAAACEEEAAGARTRAEVAQDVARHRTEAFETAARERVQAEEAIKSAQHTFDELHAAAATFDLGSIRADRLRLTARRDDLIRAQQLDAKLTDIARRRASLKEDAAVQAAAIKLASSERAAVLKKKRLAEAALQQAERAHDEASQASTKSLKTLRGTLEVGRPCPVCGATDHPYVTDDHDFDTATVKVLKRRLKECQAAVDALAAAEVEQRTLAATATKRQKQIVPELQRLTSEHAEVEDRWQAEPVASELRHLPEVAARARGKARPLAGPNRDDAARSARAGWFQRRLSDVTARIKDLNDAEKSAHAATSARDAARTALDQARAALNDAVRREQNARGDLVGANATLDATSDAVRRAEEQRDQLLADLDPVGGGTEWRGEWLAATEPFRQRQEGRAAEYRERQVTRQRSIDAIGRLDVRIDGLTKAADAAATELRRAQEALERVETQLTEKRGIRSLLFDGRPVVDVQRELDAAIESSRAAVEEHRTGLQGASGEQAAAAARLQEARRTLVDRERAADASGRQMNEWLQAYNSARPAETPLDVDGLRTLLAHDTVWIGGERTELQTLDAAFERAGTVLLEREERRRAIERGRPTDEPADVLHVRKGEVAIELEKARAARIEAEAEIRKDDENRLKAQNLAADIESQHRVAALWARMNDLIGSADGRKFRNYAQQLTLDVLLGYGNHHLSDLARRYSLRRLDDRLALIVVDRDMADEVRSVYSLSGGESFLVSLALALGLASLSANRVRVESLFIDEGFGALDADTLSIAMDALDRVHAQGRKVGVISHVQEMAERIGTQVRVERQSGGRSRVIIAG